jgi:hypothetical protein
MSVGLTREVFVDTVSHMARPKKPPGEGRYNFLRIRLTEEERHALDGAAKSRSLETSTWARSELLALARKLSRQEARK